MTSNLFFSNDACLYVMNPAIFLKVTMMMLTLQDFEFWKVWSSISFRSPAGVGDDTASVNHDHHKTQAKEDDDNNDDLKHGGQQHHNANRSNRDTAANK